MFFSKIDYRLRRSPAVLRTATQSIALAVLFQQSEYINQDLMNTRDGIWRGHFYVGRCKLNGFIMTAYAPLLCCLSTPRVRRWFRTKQQHGDTAIPFLYFLHFFVISRLIDRLSKKYVSYLSDVSPARSSHANRVEDSPSLSRVRASMQNALISRPIRDGNTI